MKTTMELRFFQRAVIYGLFLLAQTLFAQGVSFVSSTLPVGPHPVSIVVADINGDGRPDLISANRADSTLTIWTNAGNGSFGSNATLIVGLQPGCVAAVDINGDGKVALISANTGSVSPWVGTNLTVLTNDGSGDFGSNTTLTVDEYPYSLAVADINGDGTPDLVSLSFSQVVNRMTLLTNNGSGGFAFKSSLNLSPATHFCVVAADVNGDGKPDLIYNSDATAFTPASLTVLTNDGSGNFGFKTNIAVSSSLQYLANGYGFSFVAADVNHDGHMDLICATVSPSRLIVLTNNGSGDFGTNAILSVGGGANAVAVADINGDGNLDLISANGADSTLTVLTNNGHGGWGFNSTLAVGAGPVSLMAADLNGDGRPDLISANYAGNTLTVLANIPRLTISRSATNAIVSWPSSWTGWSLMQNSDLTTSNWSACTGIADDGTNRSLTIPSPMGSQFFRLSSP
jgi:hypothetical protein